MQVKQFWSSEQGIHEKTDFAEVLEWKLQVLLDKFLEVCFILTFLSDFFDGRYFSVEVMLRRKWK
jgi:hypothetical protein